MTLILATNETGLYYDRNRACQAAASLAVQNLLDELVCNGWSPQEAALAINTLSWSHLLEAAVGRRKPNGLVSVPRISEKPADSVEPD